MAGTEIDSSNKQPNPSGNREASAETTFQDLAARRPRDPQEAGVYEHMQGKPGRAFLVMPVNAPPVDAFANIVAELAAPENWGLDHAQDLPVISYDIDEPNIPLIGHCISNVWGEQQYIEFINPEAGHLINSLYNRIREVATQFPGEVKLESFENSAAWPEFDRSADVNSLSFTARNGEKLELSLTSPNTGGRRMELTYTFPQMALEVEEHIPDSENGGHDGVMHQIQGVWGSMAQNMTGPPEACRSDDFETTAIGISGWGNSTHRSAQRLLRWGNPLQAHFVIQVTPSDMLGSA